MLRVAVVSNLLIEFKVKSNTIIYVDYGFKDMH